MLQDLVRPHLYLVAFGERELRQPEGSPVQRTDLAAHPEIIRRHDATGRIEGLDEQLDGRRAVLVVIEDGPVDDPGTGDAPLDPEGTVAVAHLGVSAGDRRHAQQQAATPSRYPTHRASSSTRVSHGRPQGLRSRRALRSTFPAGVRGSSATRSRARGYSWRLNRS